jgi:hypothetical protein
VETADKRWADGKQGASDETNYESLDVVKSLFGELTVTRVRTLLTASKTISVLPLHLNSLKSGCC